MRTFHKHANSTALVIALAALTVPAASAAESSVLPPISARFAAADVSEEPSFQKHVVPLFGRLGCNGRACHGSFQGRGGFRLSLFGYDFQADHDALMADQSGRVDPESPADSLIIEKPTDADLHEGGLRYEKDSWQHHVLHRWIEAGAKFDKEAVVALERLEISPSELLFSKAGEQVQLRVVAVWADGAKEDVTPLCRFQSNNDQIAKIDQQGLVTSAEPGDTHVVVFYDNGVVPIEVIRPVSDLAGNKYPKVPTPTKVDRLVVEKLCKLGVVPSDTCTDAEFLRRVSLDMTGSLPTAAQVEKFLADKSPNKRAEKIDQLLESPAYAAWWTTKLCDYTGNNDQQLNNVLPRVQGKPSSAGQAWYEWIYQRVEQNVPYDELVAGIVTATSRRSGQTYTEYCEEMSKLCHPDSDSTFADMHAMPFYWARRDFREVEAQTITFAYAFMGIRIQCAQCHKHPFDQWTKDDFAQFQGFFGRTQLSQNVNRGPEREEYEAIIKALGADTTQRNNQLRRQFAAFLADGKTVPFPQLIVAPSRNGRGRNSKPTTTAKLLGGETVDLNGVDDPRQPLMQWLRSKGNPFFAKAFVNRVWANYFNVGIVNPPDDLSLANAPSNQALLDYLARGFIDNDFDMKWLHREITRSRTYQLSWHTNETNAADERNFSRAVPRRMPAEIVYDALQIATASDDRAAQFHTDLTDRAIAVPTASNRNQTRGPLYALSVFGRSTRESNCDCDRSQEASLLQTVFLQNDADVLAMIDTNRNGWINQLTRQLKPQSAAARGGQSPRRVTQQQLRQFENRIKQLQKAGNKQQAERLRARLKQMRQQLAKNDPTDKQQVTPKEATQAKPADAADIKRLVEQAYLRTVSRYPDDSELKRSLEFVENAEDPVKGLSGLLWALVNTKEFIVNH